MAMKVFDLACDRSHRFEGWFASLDAFDEQAGRRLIACPVCGSSAVTKLLSAPRLNLGAAERAGERATAADRGRPGGPDRDPARPGQPGQPGQRRPDQGGRSGRSGPSGPAGPSGRSSSGGPWPGDAGRRTPGADAPARRAEGSGRPTDAADGGDPVEIQRQFFALARKLIESTEDVGDRFADEARKIHYDEAPQRAIRGSATREQAAELHDEGIEVFALPVPESLKGPLQ